MSDRPIGIALIRLKRDEYLAAAERLRPTALAGDASDRAARDCHVAMVQAWDLALGTLGAETEEERWANEQRIVAEVEANRQNPGR